MFFFARVGFFFVTFSGVVSLDGLKRGKGRVGKGRGSCIAGVLLLSAN